MSDEANNVYDPNGHTKFNRDIDNWIGLMGEKNIDGKIGLIRYEGSTGRKGPSAHMVNQSLDLLNSIMPRGQYLEI